LKRGGCDVKKMRRAKVGDAKRRRDEERELRVRAGEISRERGRDGLQGWEREGEEGVSKEREKPSAHSQETEAKK